MIIGTIRSDVWHRSIFAALLVVSVFVQSLVPTGWMFSASGAALELCEIAPELVSDSPGTDGGHENAHDPHTGKACPFSGLGLWVKADTSSIGVADFSVAGASVRYNPAGIAAPPRAPSGSPLGSRAPPAA